MLECPNEGNSSNKRPKSFGSSMNDNIAATCYRCQEIGHYASGQCPIFGKARIANLIFLCLACPNGAKQPGSTPNVSENNARGECFKCGKSGHWSKGMLYISLAVPSAEKKTYIPFTLRLPAE